MNAKDFVNSLFAGYEETQALAEFKEELLANLNAKIESLEKNGMDAGAAFSKASAELGDVSALADELSLKKRKEVFEEVYMDIRRYMTAPRVAGYVIFGVLAFFGLLTGCMAYFSSRQLISTELSLTALFGAMMPFLTAAVTGFTFLGVTQETAAVYPLKKKRAAWYAAAAGLITFGITAAPITFFAIRSTGGQVEVTGSLGVLLAFMLPGIGLLAFLVLTEKNRLKPWAGEMAAGAMQREMALWNDPAVAARFGMFSGAIWIFAMGIFFALGFLIGFRFSWLAFVFAIALQLLVQGFMSKESVSRNSNSHLKSGLIE
jgi:hypothetical protein